MMTITDNALREMANFLSDPKMLELTTDYYKNLRKRNVDIGFNLFELISDHYYRETFHSDILNALLDPAGKHQGQNKYLDLFLEFIKSHGAKINLSDYSNAQVAKEECRIDILIKGSKKAIIIENKINNAADQPKQLPKYLSKVEDKGYACDAIVYLRLNSDAYPDSTEWTEKEREDVGNRICIVCAYNDTPNDLLKGWLVKCEEVSTNPDAKHIIRQYGSIIKKLGGNIMNKPIMEKFYNTMLDDENFKTALILKEMLDELVLYRVENIINRFKENLPPFSDIRRWSDRDGYDAYFTGLYWRGAHFGLDIWVFPESYSLQFWDRNATESVGQAEAILQEMGCLDDFNLEDNGKYKGRFIMKKTFAFPAEEKILFEHITNFNKRLGEVVKY